MDPKQDKPKEIHTRHIIVKLLQTKAKKKKTSWMSKSQEYKAQH